MVNSDIGCRGGLVNGLKRLPTGEVSVEAQCACRPCRQGCVGLSCEPSSKRNYRQIRHLLVCFSQKVASMQSDLDLIHVYAVYCRVI